MDCCSARRTSSGHQRSSSCLVIIFVFAGPLILGDHWGIDAIALFGLWFVLLIAAVVYLIAGITTKSTPATQQ